MLDAYLSGQTPDIRKLIREAPVIPESLDARDVVAILRASPVYMGLVHDEYGVFQGVVTTADTLEAIVGSFHTNDGPAERPYQTFAGFLLQEFGKIPGISDRIEVDGWRFEIVDLDGRRIDKVLASRLEAS